MYSSDEGNNASLIERLSTVLEYAFMFFHHFHKGKNSCDFLFASLNGGGGGGGGRVVRWCCVNFQCRGVLQFGLQ